MLMPSLTNMSAPSERRTRRLSMPRSRMPRNCRTGFPGQILRTFSPFVVSKKEKYMAIMATDSGGGGDFSPVPAGTHFAVCDQVVDLGKQRIVSQMYGESIKHQVYIRWQIPAERVEWEFEGQKKEGPAVIGKTYTVSLGDKANLRKDLQAW